jgi:hypothetical protein
MTQLFREGIMLNVWVAGQNFRTLDTLNTQIFNECTKHSSVASGLQADFIA